MTKEHPGHKEKKEEHRHHHKEEKEHVVPIDPSGRLSNDLGGDWNITWVSKTSHHKVTDRGIACHYPAGGFAGESGTHFVAQPSCFPSSTSAKLSYTVSVPADFDFVKGGKLGPGLFIGDKGAGGGNWMTNGASFRVMWREGGTVVAYLYLCEDVGKFSGDAHCPLVKAQGKGFVERAHFTGRTGIDLWREGGMALKRGADNRIELEITLNTPGKADGVVGLTVNGKKNSFDGVRWRDTKGMGINGLMVASWFGGGDKGWAPKKDQHLLFKDVVVSTRA